MTIEYVKRADLKALQDEIIRKCRTPDLFMIFLFMWLIMFAACSNSTKLDKLQESVDKMQVQLSRSQNDM